MYYLFLFCAWCLSWCLYFVLVRSCFSHHRRRALSVRPSRRPSRRRRQSPVRPLSVRPVVSVSSCPSRRCRRRPLSVRQSRRPSRRPLSVGPIVIFRPLSVRLVVVVRQRRVAYILACCMHKKGSI